MGAIDHDVRNASAHNTLIIPQRAALRLRASRVEHRDLELVVERLGRGKGERTVCSDSQGVAQDVLEDEGAVSYGAIVRQYALESYDCPADAKRHRRACDHNAGDIRSSCAGVCANAELASLHRCGGLREDCYGIDSTSGDGVFERESLIPAAGANRELFKVAVVLQDETGSDETCNRAADGIAQYAGDRNVRDVGGSRSAATGHRADLVRADRLSENRDSVDVRAGYGRHESERPVRRNLETVAAVVLQD